MNIPHSIRVCNNKKHRVKIRIKYTMAIKFISIFVLKFALLSN